jgi:predicted ATPase/Tfp pilus assembly protein PilF
LRETGSTPLHEALTGYLRDKDVLLILDNFEQVVAAAPAIAGLLTACPRLKVVVSSREVLRIYGEHEYAVPPLPMPPQDPLPPLEALTQYAAVALFIARAQQVKHDFAVTHETAPAVAEICWRLDGLPLAIELAAARSKLLAPQALLARLSRRLPTLTGGARDLPARQQTLRGTIDWSYNLLSSDEQALFARFSVFVGGCTLQAAEAVCVAGSTLGLDILDDLASLLDKSLLRQEENPAGGEPRYMMLETLREYAEERLVEGGTERAVRAAHAQHLLALAEEAEPHLTGPHQATWLARLDAEHDNLRAALRWTQAHDERSAVGLRISSALSRYWYVRGHFREGHSWLERFVALRTEARTVAPEVRTVLANALLGAGILAGEQNNYARAAISLEESLALFRALDNERGMADSLCNLGHVAQMRGDYAAATDLLQKSLAQFRALGNNRGIGDSLNLLGLVAQEEGDDTRATVLMEESLALARELGDKQGIGYALNNLGNIASEQGNYARATVLYEEFLVLMRDLGHKRGIGIALNNLGVAAQEKGDDARATVLYQESLAQARELDDKLVIACALEGLARAATAPDTTPAALHRAARLLSVVQTLREAISTPHLSGERAVYEHTVATLRTAMGDTAFNAAWAEGQALTLDQAIALALGTPPA